jgi:predicted site-specific integrase-resolvase
MPYSLQSAATACGVNRSTILRAIKSGRISATKDELGAMRSRKVLSKSSATPPGNEKTAGLTRSAMGRAWWRR